MTPRDALADLAALEHRYQKVFKPEEAEAYQAGRMSFAMAAMLLEIRAHRAERRTDISGMLMEE